jgi:AcrR family transcriptional regulator
MLTGKVNSTHKDMKNVGKTVATSTMSQTRTQTKKNITDAFWEIYKREGIQGVTVKEIIKKAGYNRSTFYEYFEDPKDVLLMIELSLIPTFETLPPLELIDKKIGMPIHEFIEFFKSKQEYYLVLLGEKGDPSFSKSLKLSIKEMFLQKIQFKQATMKHLSEFTIEFILSGMVGLLMAWLSDKSKNKITENDILQLVKLLMPDMVITD